MSEPDRRRPPRLDALAVRRTLKDEGLRARHSLSQNFLADPDVLQAIVDLAAPGPGKRILEVGPGLGIVTGALLDGGASVTAVELDARLADRLGRVFEGAIALGVEHRDATGALTLVRGDILDQEIATLVAPPYEVVANVPYHITSPILHRFLGAPPRPERLVLMLQREVAERIAAAPGAMSYLSVFVQYHARVELAFRVPREAFEPAPEVESAVVVLVPRAPGFSDAAGRLDAAGEADLWRLVQAGFHERRKMLRNVLSRQLPLEPVAVDRVLAAAGVAADRRPQTLALEDWLRLRTTLDDLVPRWRRNGAKPGKRSESDASPGATGDGGR